MRYLDTHTDVLAWSSEEVSIPYRSPIDGRVHRYFPDFILKRRNKDGGVDTVMVEIKPFKETKPPTVQKKATKRYIKEVHTWGVNESKWKAAMEYCADRKWKFMILTEHELGIKQ
jgi:TnsA endonuclease N terminal